MGTTLEQVAAHEAGHTIVGLAVGARLDSITMVKGKLPEAHLPDAPDATFMVDFVPASTKQIEARQTYLVGVGGMAGEIVLEGAYHTPGAADDIAKLQGVNLTDAQIQGLIEIAAKIIKVNLVLWQKIQRRMLSGIERKQYLLEALQ